MQACGQILGILWNMHVQHSPTQVQPADIVCPTSGQHEREALRIRIMQHNNHLQPLHLNVSCSNSSNLHQALLALLEIIKVTVLTISKAKRTMLK
jgi:hypothetical protein